MTPFQRISLSQDENEAMLEESQLRTSSGELSNADRTFLLLSPKRDQRMRRNMRTTMMSQLF